MAIVDVLLAVQGSSFSGNAGAMNHGVIRAGEDTSLRTLDSIELQALRASFEGGY